MGQEQRRARAMLLIVQLHRVSLEIRHRVSVIYPSRCLMSMMSTMSLKTGMNL